MEQPSGLFCIRTGFCCLHPLDKEICNKFEVEIHAWVLMTNHVHLLCTPRIESSLLSIMMQGLGRQYVHYSYKRAGILWEGRYKSCLLEAENYLLELYRYIEHNPVRAGMVGGPSQYPWSSYPINALGKNLIFAPLMDCIYP